MSLFQLQNNDMLSRLKPFGILFEKSLSDLIREIRSHSKISAESLQEFLESAIVECKNELMSMDLETKATAILKLAYLEMYGFDMSWCNFQILEVMSSNSFQQKRIGYLAAMQSFKNEHDILMLATNQFKKDLHSHNYTEVGLALSGIATVVTPNLARDINDDVMIKLNHSRPYIRKKAILCMYKVFLQYPDSLRMNVDKVISMVDDDDFSVVTATVNVICEISKTSPRLFLDYLPKFFQVLEETKNNWLIIRFLKLFQSLSKVEPRLKKKVLPLIVNMMHRTQASSLKYECINCIVGSTMLSSDSSKDEGIAKLCIEELMKFFDARDSNLNFVGLLVLINIIKLFPSLLHEIPGVSRVVIDCLTDDDLIIKRKALEISQYLVNEDNIVELVRILLVQLVPNEDNIVPECFTLEISMKILSFASQDNYSNVPNFRWYIFVLKDIINLTLLASTTSSNAAISQATAGSMAVEIGKEFKNLSTKVPSMRPVILKEVIVPFCKEVAVVDNCPLLLKDFYWILGEYVEETGIYSSEESDNEEDGENQEKELASNLGQRIELFNLFVNYLVDTKIGGAASHIFLLSRKLVSLRPDILVVLIQALVKLFNGIVRGYVSYQGVDLRLPNDLYYQIAYFLYKLICLIDIWSDHPNYEVQERALSWLEFLRLSLEAMLGEDYSQINKLLSEEVEFYKQQHKDHVYGLNIENPESDEEALSSESDSEEDEESSSTSESGASYAAVNSGDEQKDETHMNEDKSSWASMRNTKKWNQKDVTEGEEDKPEDIDRQGMDENNTGNAEKELREIPVLLLNVLPSFFNAYPLLPVAKDAQSRITPPVDLDLDYEINPHVFEVATDSENDIEDDYSIYIPQEVSELREHVSAETTKEEKVARKQEREEKLKDIPYYITSNKEKKPKSSSNDKSSKKAEVLPEDDSLKSRSQVSKKKKVKKEKVKVLSDMTFELPTGSKPVAGEKGLSTKQISGERSQQPRKKKNALNIDFSSLNGLDVNPSQTELNTDSREENVAEKVDLEEMRQKLVQASLTDKKKKKKTKPKSSPEDSGKTDGTSDTKETKGKNKKPKKRKAVIVE